ncbi:MAG: 16S rRNA (adenine(1518)-N(6)/adenine(1519)-N(6))-dimethyltransferase RsmA [Patescibacteria group bacterium]|jgi:16S rRNA (adenine1518-N6/adenine1519-N6)-dimethyltransferase
MNLLEQTQYLIKKTGLKPDKLKGQNFCIDQKVLTDMIKASGLTNKDNVLEVGPGFGFLTAELVKKAAHVTAVELEPALFKIIKNMQAVHNNLQAIEGDILKINDNRLPSEPYKIIANLPYGITSAFLKKFLTSSQKPQSITLLIQKEVAERICAPAGQLSLLGISVQLYAQPKIMGIVLPKSFWPMPAVNSAIINISSIRPFPYDDVAEEVFWRTVRAGFCAKRKTLQNNLANSFHISKEQALKLLNSANLAPLIRAQELSVKDWHTLSLLVD